jgi:hypothetical protein
MDVALDVALAGGMDVALDGGVDFVDVTLAGCPGTFDPK